MNILISGGSGFIGSALTQFLQNQADINAHITWLTRDTSQDHPSYVTMMSYDVLTNTQATFDVIINLAGAGIADKRWSDNRKQLLMSSRIQPTQAIIEYIARIPQRPKLLVSGSAIGWYGVRGNLPLDEDSSAPSNAKDDFAHQICEAWEQEASIAAGLGVPVAILRTGVVIHPTGGMIAKLLTPFKVGFGGQLGDGSQIMSWISLEDWIRAAVFIIERHLAVLNSSDGWANQTTIYNFTAPNPISNSEFTKALGHWLHRPTFMTLPAFLLKLLFGEMSTLLIDGQKVLPKALLEAGFEFRHETLEQALY